MKKMLVLSLALSVFAVGSVFANDSVADAARGPRKVNVSLVLPPPPAHSCCGHHHKPEPPKHNCHPGAHKFEGKCDHHHHNFYGPRPKPGNDRPAVRPGNHNGNRPPVNGARPGNGNHNEPPKGGNRR